MKKILLINGHEYFKKSPGELNRTLFEEWCLQLKDFNETKTTVIEDGYDVNEEIEKWQWANVIIMQTPMYWFSIPGAFKKYIDRIYMDNVFFKGSDQYGRGGQFTEKEYLLSLTWNAPESIFNNQKAFYEGKSLDEAILHLHKMNEYIGMRPLPTFSVHDVVKNTNIEHYKQKLKAHVKEVFE